VDKVTFITTSSLPLFQAMPGLIKDFGMSTLDFKGVLQQNEIPMKHIYESNGKWHTIHGNHLEGHVYYNHINLKKPLHNEALVYVKEHDICHAQATHMRMTDSSANLNTFQYWLYVNNSDSQTFIMTDNPLAQEYFISEFPNKILLFKPISQYIQVNDIIGERKKELAGPYNVQFLEKKVSLKKAKENLLHGKDGAGSSDLHRISHIMMTEEDRESLPNSYRYTTLSHTIIDVTIASYAKDFKQSMYSSLSDLVNLLRPRARRECEEGLFDKVKQ
jgi:hypothetical protein